MVAAQAVRREKERESRLAKQKKDATLAASKESNPRPAPAPAPAPVQGVSTKELRSKRKHLISQYQKYGAAKPAAAPASLTAS